MKAWSPQINQSTLCAIEQKHYHGPHPTRISSWQCIEPEPRKPRHHEDPTACKWHTCEGLEKVKSFLHLKPTLKTPTNFFALLHWSIPSQNYLTNTSSWRCSSQRAGRKTWASFLWPWATAQKLDQYFAGPSRLGFTSKEGTRNHSRPSKTLWSRTLFVYWIYGGELQRPRIMIILQEHLSQQFQLSKTHGKLKQSSCRAWSLTLGNWKNNVLGKQQDRV